MENGQKVVGSIRPTERYDVGHVQEVVRQAHDELRQLLQQRAEVMSRIGTVKQTIAGLANLFGDGVLSEELLELVDRKSNGRQPGFTKACRMVLMEADRALTARDVCDQIQERIPPMLARHKDPMASVTTVLNRLVEYGEAQAVVLDNGRRAWRGADAGCRWRIRVRNCSPRELRGLAAVTPVRAYRLRCTPSPTVGLQFGCSARLQDFVIPAAVTFPFPDAVSRARTTPRADRA